MKKPVLFIIAVLVVLFAAWSWKERLLYHYNVWRLAHAVEDREIHTYDQRIRSLVGKTGTSCFVATYNDTGKPNRVRRAAATALIHADVALAETVFAQHLDSTNPDVSGMAIRDLGTIRSTRYRDRILQYGKSGNEIVRWSVVDYLGHFHDAGSVGLLRSIRSNDRSAMIRNAAAACLKRLSGQAGKEM